MSSKASGDAPQTENNRRILQKKEDIYNWKMSYEAWQTFNDLRQKGLFYDVTLTTDKNEKFPAHRIVLCTCGHYFRSLFSGRWKSSEEQEIEIPGVRGSMMKRIIHFAYTRRVIVQSISEAKELIIAGSHFGVDEIIRACAVYLSGQLNMKNCLQFWEFSRVYYCKDLEIRAFSYILDNFQLIAALPETESSRNFHDLDADDLCSILDHDELNVKNEKLPLRVVLRWCENADSRYRKKHFYNLLASVRLGLLTATFLESFLKNHTIISESPETRALVEKQIVLSRMNESLGEDKGALSRLAMKLKASFMKPSIRLPLSTRECEVLRRTSRPRYPREILLVIGGWSANAPTASSEAFDPGTRLWNDTSIAFPDLLKKPRAYHGICYIDGYLYVVGGFDGQVTYNSCDRYNIISGKWKKMCGMHRRRCYVGVAQLNGLIYAVGGSEGGGEHLRLKSAERYDPNVNSWARLPDMTERRSDAGVCGLGGRLYVAGGFTGHQCVFTVEYFDAESLQWCRITPMRIPRSGVTIIAYKGRVLALGGFDGNTSRLNSVEAFDPTLNLWTTLPDMLTGRSNFSACVVRGKLLVMGGFNGISTCCNVEYFEDEDEDISLGAADDSLLPGPSNRRSSTEPNPNGRSFEGNGSGDNEEDIMINVRQRPQQVLQANREVSTGIWRRLPDMKVSRSALSCCAVKGLPPTFLRSVVAPVENSGQRQADGRPQQWTDLDKLIALCIQNAFDG